MTQKLTKNILKSIDAQLGEIAWYSQIYDDRVIKISNENFLKVKRFLNHKRIQPKNILEIGTSDRITIHKLSSHFKCKCYGLDISSDALKKGLKFAIKNLENLNYYGIAADFHNMPFSDNYFDFVFCSASLHHTYKLKKVLNEVKRVLKKNSYFYISNEPIKRKLTLNLFDINRKNEMTIFEKELDKNLILNFLRKDVDEGNQPEKKFGIIENHNSIIEDYSYGFEVTKKKLKVQKNFKEEFIKLKRIKKKFSTKYKLYTSFLLNAKRCNNFFSLADKELKFRKIYKKDIEKITNMIDQKIDLNATSDKFSLLGGKIDYLILKNTYKNKILSKKKNIKFKKNKINFDKIKLENKFVYLHHDYFESFKNNEIFKEKIWEKTIDDGNMVFNNLKKENLLDIKKPNSNCILLIKLFHFHSSKNYNLKIITNNKIFKTIKVTKTFSSPLKIFSPKENKNLKVIFKFDKNKKDIRHHLKITGMKLFQINKI